MIQRIKLTGRQALLPVGLVITVVLVLLALISTVTGRNGTLLATSAHAEDSEPVETHAAPEADAGEPELGDDLAMESVFPRDPLQSLALALQERERDLDTWEQDLKEREKRLAALNKEIEENLRKTEQTLKQMQQIAGTADRNREDQIAQWVEIYQSMTPDQASTIMEGLELTFALRILSTMDAKKAGKIVNSMDPDKAIEISKQLNQRPI